MARPGRDSGVARLGERLVQSLLFVQDEPVGSEAVDGCAFHGSGLETDITALLQHHHCAGGQLSEIDAIRLAMLNGELDDVLRVGSSVTGEVPSSRRTSSEGRHACRVC